MNTDDNVEQIMNKIREKIKEEKSVTVPITVENIVSIAAERVEEKIKTIHKQNSKQSDALKHLESFNFETKKQTVINTLDTLENELRLTNLGVDIQVYNKIDTSKPKILRWFVLKIRNILQNEVRFALNPVVNNQIRFNSHIISVINDISKLLPLIESELKSNRQTIHDLESELKSNIVTAQISRLYNHYLHREPDSSEIEYWRSNTSSGKTKYDELVDKIRYSEEATTVLRNDLKGIGITLTENNIAYKEIDGHIIYFDVNDRFLLESFSYNDLYERNTTLILKKLLKKGMNVINTGANVGYFTLLSARQIGSTGKVFAFEPFPPTVEFLQKNVEANGYKNVEIITSAVSNETNKAHLWLKESSNKHFVSEKGISGLKNIEINTISIDDFLKDRNISIDFIIMDAEGSEKYILEGMKKTLQINPNLEIITEYNPYTLELAGTSGESFLDTIKECGFYTYIIDDNTQKLEPITKDRLLNEVKFPKTVNLYLTRNSRQF